MPVLEAVKCARGLGRFVVLSWFIFGQSDGIVCAMNGHSSLFNTVAKHDYLGFWANETLNARGVASFLDLDKRDVAKVAGVSPASVPLGSENTKRSARPIT